MHFQHATKAFLKILVLQYKLVYKKGADNKAANTISKQSTADELLVISTSTPRWLEIIVESYQIDPQTQQLLAELSIIGTNDKGFALVDGLIRHKSKYMVGHVLLALHTSGLGGHSGVTATYHKIRALFSWPHMKKDIQQFISKCQACSQENLSIVAYLDYYNLYLSHLKLGTL